MKIYLLLLYIAFGFVSTAQDQWVIKDSINGAPRSAASSFIINGEGYTIAGLDESGFRRKMYSYTYWQDDWDDESSIGGLNGSGLSRGSASAFSIGNKGYICLGQGDTNPFFKDLWEYDANSGTWTQKANFIGSPRRSAVAFTIDTIGYVGTGIDDNGFTKDMYTYSPSTNTWTQINDFGGTARKEAVGFTMGGQAYVGTGDDGVYKNDFWQYEPSTDSWIQKANFPGAPRKGAVGWGIFPQAFICTGEDNSFNYTNDLWEYNYYTNTWVQRADFLGLGRSNAFAFVLEDVAFVGSGYNGEFFDDVYAYRRVLGIESFDSYSNISVYPNPAQNVMHIMVDPQDIEVHFYSIDGKDLTNNVTINQTISGFDINRNGLSSGNYFMSLTHLEYGQVYQSKIVLL